MAGIGSILSGFIPAKEQQREQDYQAERQERLLNAQILMHAAESPDISLDTKRQLLNQAGMLYESKGQKGFLGVNTKHKATKGMALGDMIFSQQGLDKTDTVVTSPGGDWNAPGAGAAVPVTADNARAIATGTLQNPMDIKDLPPPPEAQFMRHGSRTSADIAAQREQQQFEQRIASEYRIKQPFMDAASARDHAERIAELEVQSKARVQAADLAWQRHQQGMTEQEKARINQDRNEMAANLLAADTTGTLTPADADAQAAQITIRHEKAKIAALDASTERAKTAPVTGDVTEAERARITAEQERQERQIQRDEQKEADALYGDANRTARAEQAAGRAAREAIRQRDARKSQLNDMTPGTPEYTKAQKEADDFNSESEKQAQLQADLRGELDDKVNQLASYSDYYDVTPGDASKGQYPYIKKKKVQPKRMSVPAATRRNGTKTKSLPAPPSGGSTIEPKASYISRAKFEQAHPEYVNASSDEIDNLIKSSAPQGKVYIPKD